MPAASVIYTLNLVLGAVLAGVMSRQWRLQVGGTSPRLWIVAAWVLTAADVLFAVRGVWPTLTPRMLPTLAVTAGHTVLLLAAREWAGRPRRVVLAGLAVGGHLLLLVFVALTEQAGWRATANSLVWSTLSFLAALALARAPAVRARTMALPAIILGAQGVFHLVRAALASGALNGPVARGGPLVQMLGDLEVSLFMVALFVSVLVSFLQQSNQELRHAVENVKQLSGMLPLCAWCKNVRNDDGYWTRIEHYLAHHQISVTHALCEPCAAREFSEFLDEPAPDPAAGGR